MHPGLQKILIRAGVPDLVEILSTRLNNGSLTTLLLEVYRQKAAALKPSQLLASLAQNRFVQPAEGERTKDFDPIAFREVELSLLRLAREAGFEPVDLSPVAPLGASSAYGKVHQNNVLTALRGCEVVSDPTNVMLLLMVARLQDPPSSTEDLALHWVTSHRVLRTTFWDRPDCYPSFQVFATSSLLKVADTDQLAAALFAHLRLNARIYRSLGLGPTRLVVRCKYRKRRLGQRCLELLQTSGEFELESLPEPGSDYYEGVQVKTFARSRCPKAPEEFEIADCGFVSWPRELTGNPALSGVISGIGMERMLSLVPR